MWNEVIITLATGLVPIVLTLISALAVYGIAKLKEKSSNDNFDKYFSILESTVTRIVGETQQTIVAGLKVASEDGKLTKEESLEVLKFAKDKIYAQLPAIAISTIGTIYTDIDSLIISLIENKVNEIR